VGDYTIIGSDVKLDPIKELLKKVPNLVLFYNKTEPDIERKYIPISVGHSGKPSESGLNDLINNLK